MNLVASFVRNPVKVAVGVLLAAIFGTIALTQMPLQLTPEVITPVISIQTAWPGASPQEVEREVVQEQEEQLKSVEGVTKLSSECSDSSGKVTLEFGVDVNMQEALVKVSSRLGQVRDYPEGVREPVISTTSSSDSPIAWFILRPRVPATEELEAFAKSRPDLAELMQPALRTSSVGLRNQRLEAIRGKDPELDAILPPQLELPKLQRYAEDVIEARFERVSGVSNSNVLGGREDQITVTVDARKLADRGLTLSTVRARLLAENVDTSAGDFWEGKRRYVVRTLGRFRTLDQIRAVVIDDTANTQVLLGDVATVAPGYRKPTALVRNFGSSVLAVNVIRESTANTVEVMEGLREALQDLNDTVLRRQGLRLIQVYDETIYIDSAVGLVTNNLRWGGLLTILVLLIFLGSARSTLVVALAIPTSIMGTFLILGLMGRSLNVISLAGMAFAIGMLVDNAVVVLENIFRRYQAGERRRDAAVKGTQEVWGAILASTLTTMAVFLPILGLKEEAGQLFGDIALAISISVALSLFVSIIVISTAGARILPKSRDKKPGPLTRLGEAILAPFRWVGRGFVRAVVGVQGWLGRGALRQAVLAILLIGTAVAGSIKLFPKPEYLPTGNRNLVIGLVFPPSGYNLDQLTELGRGVESRLRPYWDLDDGATSPDPRFPAIEDFFFVVRGSSVFLGVRSRDPERAGELRVLINQAVSGIPGTFAFANQTSLFARGIGEGRSIDIEIVGADLPTLIGVGGRVFGQVRGMYPTAQVRPVPSLDLSNPEVHVKPRPDRMALMDVTARDLGYWVDSLVDGALAGEYELEGNTVDVVLRGSAEAAGSIQELRSLPVAVPTGEAVSIESLANLYPSSGPAQINRRERQRAITISVAPPDEVPLQEAIERINQELLEPIMAAAPKTAGAPPYQLRLAGTADKLDATIDALLPQLILALAITYLLLAALFESWLYPFIIVLVVPLGAVGGLGALALLNLFVVQSLDVLTMLAFFILIGTVVNNPILIVHQSLVQIREKGMAPQEAVTEAVRLRLRPIFMTTFTTVFGLLPLVISPGAGSELYRGLGSVLLGGLIVSTIFTVLLTPILLRLFFASKLSFLRLVGWDQAEEGEGAAGAV